MISRQVFLAGLAGTLATGAGVHAQSTAKLPRIGVIGEQGPGEPRLEAFRQGLRALGYVEGQNVLVEYRYLEGVIDRVCEQVSSRHYSRQQLHEMHHHCPDRCHHCCYHYYYSRHCCC